jgi:ABC-type polysaccharide/polyol phosphate export permease
MLLTAKPSREVTGTKSRWRLWLQLVVDEVRREFAGMVLGTGWAIVQPLLILGAFFFLFTALRVTKNAPHGALGEVGIILSGLVPWFYFIRSFSHGIGTLDQHAPLVNQINFPAGVLPFVTVGRNLIDFAIGLVMLVGLAISQGWLGWSALILIPTAVLFTIFLVGLVGILAPLGAMLRDLRAVLPLVVRLGLWISPILYLPGRLEAHFKWVLLANPLTYFINLVRYASFGRSFGGGSIYLSPLQNLAIATGLTVLLAAAGLIAWRSVRRVAVDYV